MRSVRGGVVAVLTLIASNTAPSQFRQSICVLNQTGVVPRKSGFGSLEVLEFKAAALRLCLPVFSLV